MPLFAWIVLHYCIGTLNQATPLTRPILVSPSNLQLTTARFSSFCKIWWVNQHWTIWASWPVQPPLGQAIRDCFVWPQCGIFHTFFLRVPLVVMPRASIHRKYLHPLVRCLSFCHALHSPFDEQTVPPPFIFIDYTVSHNVILFLFYCRYNTSLSHNTIVRMMMMNPIILIIK